jgi:hypothetical protein
VEHGSVEPVRLQKAAKQIAYDRVVVDDKDLWIHFEILDRRVWQTDHCFLTNTYLPARGAREVLPAPLESLVLQGKTVEIQRWHRQY